MKNMLMMWTLMTTLGLAVVVLAQTAAPNTSSSAAKPSKQAEDKPNLHLPKGTTADDVYKSNCTRCHSELPKLDTRQTKTIVRHMRVRANLTQDEAQALLEYLTQ